MTGTRTVALYDVWFVLQTLLLSSATGLGHGYCIYVTSPGLSECSLNRGRISQSFIYNGSLINKISQIPRKLSKVHF